LLEMGNGCDVSAEGLDTALVDLPMVGDDPNWQLFFSWIDAWELNPRLGLL